MSSLGADAALTPGALSPASIAAARESVGNDRAAASAQPSSPDSTAAPIDYKFTLAELNERSYYLVLRGDAQLLPNDATGSLPHLSSFHEHLRKAVVLANVEVCMARCFMKANHGRMDAGQFQRCKIDLDKPILDPLGQPSLPANPMNVARLHLMNEEALSPVQSDGVGGFVTKELITNRLDAEIRAAMDALKNEPIRCELVGLLAEDKLSRTLKKLARTFAAYQPSVLDSGFKDSDLLPEGGQKGGIEHVQDLVENSAQAVGYRAAAAGGGGGSGGGDGVKLVAGAQTPSRLADLALKLFEACDAASPQNRQKAAMLEALLKAGFQSGQSELVRKLLTSLDRETSRRVAEGIIEVFRTAWIGKSARDETDWLDFNCTCARALLIAHELVNFIVKNDPEGIVSEGELGPGAWTQFLKLARERPSAGKPLARAMMYVAYARASLRAPPVQEPADRRTSGSPGQHLPAPLHGLAVQACHLAIHVKSPLVVSEAIVCVGRTSAWPAIKFEMLIDLASIFPQQCGELLSNVQLDPVEMDDNVLPLRLHRGFATVAVSPKDAEAFGKGDPSGSTKDSEFFTKQLGRDEPIEAALLVQGRAWLAMLFLFWPFFDFRNPAASQMARVLGCALAAFVIQGPGSLAVAVASTAILVTLGGITRICLLAAALISFICRGVLSPVWELAKRLTESGTAAVHPDPTKDKSAGDDDDDGDTISKNQPSDSWWQSVLAQSHYPVINAAVGWGATTSSISCQKVPMAVDLFRPIDEAKPEKGRDRRQLDTLLLQKLLLTPGVPLAAFGSNVMRAIILFKWNYFIKYFILMKLLLHLAYMAVFLVYAFTLFDLEPVDGRESGLGADTPGCQLEEPTRLQFSLLIAMGAMTIDFAFQELRQIFHFRQDYYHNTWDVLDILSVILMTTSVSLHLSCSLGASPTTLRGLASVQILLLFMRLMYYAMASEKLGSFVRMVLDTSYDLLMFFVFLSVIFLGFVLAIAVSQDTSLGDEVTFIKLFTMLYGDFDASFLSRPFTADAAADTTTSSLNALTRVFVSLYMIGVTIILLNLLIAIISESYERIRANERCESLRNKALMIVGTEAHLFERSASWFYKKLAPPLPGANEDTGKRFLYLITPEYAGQETSSKEGEQPGAAAAEDAYEDEQAGRLGAIRRIVATEARNIRADLRGLEDFKKDLGELDALKNTLLELGNRMRTELDALAADRQAHRRTEPEALAADRQLHRRTEPEALTPDWVDRQVHRKSRFAGLVLPRMKPRQR